jgi:hypothetical protein
MKHVSRSFSVRKQPTRLVFLGWGVLITLVALTQSAFTYQNQAKRSPETPKDNRPQTAFTYQGQLKEGSVTANGAYTFQFTLYTGQSGGHKLGVVIKDDVAVINGSFAVQLDFGSDGLSANESWLEVAVRPASSTDPSTALSPRQRLTPTPYAILTQAEPWSLIGVSVGFQVGVEPDLVTGDKTNDDVTGAKIPERQAVKSVSPKDAPTPAAGDDVTITPGGNTSTVAAPGGAGWKLDKGVVRLAKDTNNVGIGVKKPKAKLDVAGSIHASDSVTVGNSVGLLSSSSSMLNLIEVDDANPLAIGFSNPMSTTPNPALFSSIRVGIGTLSPTATLHINGTTRFSGIATLDSGVQLQAATNGGARILGEQGDTPARPAIGFFSTNGVDDGGGGNGIFRPLANTMAFATGSAERMRITSGGAVGIGTMMPMSKLDVGGGGNAILHVAGATNPTVTAQGAYLGWNALTGGMGETDFINNVGGGTGGFAFMEVPSGGGSLTTQMFLNGAGKLGIGTTNPLNELDVIGMIRVTNMLPASGNPTVCWDSTTTKTLVLCNPSDARLKTHVTQLTNVLEKLQGIRGVSFEWNTVAKSLGSFSERREIGVIAQEVETVFPEVVNTSSSDGYKTVDYSRLTVVLIEAVKELKAQNETLKQRVAALERAATKR